MARPIRQGPQRPRAVAYVASQAPRRAPAAPPRLKAAWNDDMIGRPQRLSTSLACAFIETSIDPFAAPTTRVAAQSSGNDGERTGAASAPTKARPAAEVARPLERRAAMSPVSGIAARAPAAKESRTRLRAPSPRLRFSFSRGMAAAQAPIPRPLAKNTPSVASRSGRRRRANSRRTGSASVIVKSVPSDHGRPAPAAARERPRAGRPYLGKAFSGLRKLLAEQAFRGARAQPVETPYSGRGETRVLQESPNILARPDIASSKRGLNWGAPATPPLGARRGSASAGPAKAPASAAC